MTERSQPGDEYGTIETLFRHNLWANTTLFEVCAGLSDDQLNSKILGTYGSIRDTLQHIANSEHSYLYRVKSGQPFRRPENPAPRTMAEIQESIRVSGEGLIVAAPGVQAQESVEVDWKGAPRNVPLTIFLTQVINHATEHRAQIMVMLTQLGVEPPSIDSWSFFEANDG